MLVVGNDKKGHFERDPDYEKIRQKELEKLDLYLIRINPDKLCFNGHEEFGKISAYIAKLIKKQTKNTLIDDISKRNLDLKLKSNHAIKSKCLKRVVKNTLPNYEK